MRAILAAVCVLFFMGVALAADEPMIPQAASDAGNLEAGFPTSIIDNTTVPQGRLVVGINAGIDAGSPYPNVQDDGTPAFSWKRTILTSMWEVQYGIMPDAQITAKWPLIVGKGVVSGNFDTTLALLWAPVKEDDTMPALGVEVAVRVPTGYGKSGWDASVTGVASKKLGEVGTFLNATYTTIGNNDDFNNVPAVSRRNDTNSFKLGADYMVMDNICLVADYVNQQSWLSLTAADTDFGGAPDPFTVDRVQLLEIGARMAVTDVDTVSVGVAVGVGNGNITPDMIGTVGYQRLL